MIGLLGAYGVPLDRPFGDVLEEYEEDIFRALGKVLGVYAVFGASYIWVRLTSDRILSNLVASLRSAVWRRAISPLGYLKGNPGSWLKLFTQDVVIITKESEIAIYAGINVIMIVIVTIPYLAYEVDYRLLCSSIAWAPLTFTLFPTEGSSKASSTMARHTNDLSANFRNQLRSNRMLNLYGARDYVLDRLELALSEFDANVTALNFSALSFILINFLWQGLWGVSIQLWAG